MNQDNEIKKLKAKITYMKNIHVGDFVITKENEVLEVEEVNRKEKYLISTDWTGRQMYRLDAVRKVLT